MEFLSDLWLAIVVSAGFVWIASAIIHMALPIHKNEWKGLPDEEKVNDALRGIQPGMYMFPWCEMKEMNTPEVQEKFKRGPVGTLTIWSGPTNMGRNLILMLLYYLVVGAFVAYVGWHTIDPGAEYLNVLRVCGAAAFMAHGLGWMPRMIWFGGASREFWTYLFDSVVYAMLTAGTFGWLWL